MKRKLMKKKAKYNRIKRQIISGTVACALVMTSLLSGVIKDNSDAVGETIASSDRYPEGSKITKDEFDKLLDNYEVGDTVNTYREEDKTELQVNAGKSNKDKVVTLEGQMPEGAKAKVKDVTSKSDGNTEGDLVAAYDISILDGKKEYQPGSENPIRVEIKDKRIKTDKDIAVYHVLDNGLKQRIVDFTVVDGAISFKATGFSVYEIVEGIDPISSASGWVVASDIDTIESQGAENDEGTGGFYIGSGGTTNNGYFLTGDAVVGVTNNSDRYGLSATTTQYLGEGVPDVAAKFYFERPNSSEDKFYIYTYKDVDGVSTKCYVYLTKVSGNDSRGSLNLVPISEDPEVEDTKTLFTVSKKDGLYVLSGTADGTTYWWNRNTKDGQKGAIAAYSSDGDNNTYKMNFYYYKEMPEDVYDLDGKSCGLMRYFGAMFGNVFMADGTKNFDQLTMINVLTSENNVRDLFVEDGDITEWTFHFEEEDKYSLSAEVGGVTKYVKLDENGVTLVSADEASKLTVTPGSGADSEKISLFDGEYYLCCNVTGYAESAVGSYSTTTDAASPDIWLNFVNKTQINEDEQLIHSAKEVSVSDTEKVTNGTKVIVYTRIWNESTKSYDFYAVDHDGSLYPCFERGDAIMWLGSATGSLEWEFTEYYWEGTDDPNYYYELYNSYSDKYIAPQINGNQILSNDKIGINLDGRRDGEFYTEITAWDELYYSFAGVRAGDGEIISGPLSKADTFYFALANPSTRANQFREADTLDGEKYGITMKMADWGTDGVRNATGSEVTKNYFYDVKGSSKVDDVRGLLSTNLNDDGYPTITSPYATDPVADFSELYADAVRANHLFLKSVYEESGYFEFSSLQNFATLYNQDGTRNIVYDENGEPVNNFIVYKELGTVDHENKTTLKHGQFLPYNTLTPGLFASVNATNLYNTDARLNNNTLGLLSDDDPRKNEKLYLIKTEDVNYYFGMELEAGFTQTPSGKDAWGHDIIFEFTGDDDFWLYVDGELVIDLGGTHSAESGSINYSTGEVLVNGNETTLKDIFTENMRSRGESEEDIERMISETFEYENGNYIFKDYTEHHIKIFYMERGAGASNLHIRMNLSSVEQGNVLLKKEVTGEDAEDLDFDVVKYPYQIWYRIVPGGEEYLLTNDNDEINVAYQNSTKQVEYASSYTPPNSENSYDSVYFLSPDRNVEIHFPDNAVEYKIVECGINTEVYDHVYINGSEVEGVSIGNEDREKYESEWLVVRDHPTMVFENHVKEGAIRTLYIEKRLFDVDGNRISCDEDRTKFNYRLYLTDGAATLNGDSTHDEAYLTNRYNYYVVDPEGYLCKWNVALQDFESTDTPATKAGIKNLSEEDRDEVTFFTSIYGAIANIPADYTVMVPGLQVGMDFMVEERARNMPKGYKLIEYKRDGESYVTKTGLTENYGTVRTGESPKVFVDNKQGYGITVNKVWTDEPYTESYDPVYVALYDENDELIEGTVRQLLYPTVSTYYFLERSFDDIYVREVSISNDTPTVDDEGNVTDYGTVTPFSSGQKNTIHSELKSGHGADFNYIISYDTGEVTGLALNAREDTITNTREGGIVIRLFSWDDQTKPLANGEFTLTCEGETVGTYTSNDAGNIVILYDFEKNKTYELVETKPPAGYIGLAKKVEFEIDDEGHITLTHENGEGWSDSSEGDSAEGIIVFVNVYNKPYELKVYKHNAGLPYEPIEGTEFALYKQLYNAVIGYHKAGRAFDGYESLMTDDDGYLTLVSVDEEKVLPVGTYYLTEVSPKEGYSGIEEDIIITIDNQGNVTLDPEHSSWLGETDNTQGGEGAYEYIIDVPNTKDGVELTVTKTVTGSFGSRDKEFTFTITTDDAGAEYPWAKNGTVQDTTLSSGDTFTLSHSESVTVFMPTNTEVTISEDSEDYTPKFKLNDGSDESVSQKTFTITDNSTLSVTNTRKTLIPTGVATHMDKILILLMICIAGISFLKRKNDLEREEMQIEAFDETDQNEYSKDFMEYVEFIEY